MILGAFRIFIGSPTPINAGDPWTEGVAYGITYSNSLNRIFVCGHATDSRGVGAYAVRSSSLGSNGSWGFSDFIFLSEALPRSGLATPDPNICYDIKARADGKVFSVGTMYASGGVDTSKQYLIRSSSTGVTGSWVSVDASRIITFGSSSLGNLQAAYSLALDSDNILSGVYVLVGPDAISSSFLRYSSTGNSRNIF